MIERRLLVGTAAGMLAAAAIAGADVLLSGAEFPLNQTTVGAQVGARGRALGAARDESVIVWQSDDGDGTGVFARRFDSGGAGAEFAVNTNTVGSQGQASVSLVEGKGFVIAWSSAGGDGDGYGVAARRYDAAGTALGTEVTLNSYATANQESPSVAMAADGSFLVVWESFLQDGDQDSVVGRAFDAAGTPLGSEAVVNTYTTGDQQQPSAAALEDGTFAVAWESQGEDGDASGVFARVLDTDGVPMGSEIPINAYTTGDQKTAHVAARGAGTFVVSWSGASATDADGVIARLFDAGGAPAGGETQVNEFTTGPQARSAVASAADGSFVVVWDSLGQDGDGYGVLARRFRGDGNSDGSEFQVNSYTTGFQGYTNSVATDGAGQFVVVWADSMQDGDSFGVFGRGICTDEDEDGDCDLVCDLVPATGCFQAEAGKSTISIKDSIEDSKDQIKWKWAKGELTARDAFLDPVGSTADYRFCIYDDSSARQPLLDASFEPGGQCGDAPCWKATGTKGFAFADDTGAQHGITKVKFKSGDTGKAQVQLQARGASVGPPAPPLTGQVVVQLLASDGPTFSCWQTVYATPKKNDAGSNTASYKASGP